LEAGEMVALKIERGKCMDACIKLSYKPFRSQTWLKLKGIYCMGVYSKSQHLHP